MLVTELQRVNDTEDLVKVSSSLSWVRDGESDDLLGIDDEDGADGERNALGIDVGWVYGIKHVIESRDFAVGIGNL